MPGHCQLSEFFLAVDRLGLGTETSFNSGNFKEFSKPAYLSWLHPSGNCGTVSSRIIRVFDGKLTDDSSQ